jgi:hypothetical protein
MQIQITVRYHFHLLGRLLSKRQKMSVRKGVAGGPFHTDGGSASGVATMEGSQKLKNTPL